MEKQDGSPQTTLEISMTELAGSIRELLKTLETSADARSGALNQLRSMLDGIEKQMAKVISAQKTQENTVSQILQAVQAEQVQNKQMRAKIEQVCQLLMTPP